MRQQRVKCVEQKEKTLNTMLWCPAYTQERRKKERLQQPYVEEGDDKLIEDTKRTLHTFWKIREKKMKEKEDSERDSQ